MTAWQERVVAEEIDLAKKLAALETFLGSPASAEVDWVDRFLLKRQAEVMAQYDRILRDRISRFKS